LGIAPTRRGARQLVTHNHIVVNGDNINIPSYALKVGDLVSVREKSKSLEVIANSLSVNRSEMEWLEFNVETNVGKLVAAPERAQIPENIKEQVIVELYSK
jgi:small subunit ribosomal protein S4